MEKIIKGKITFLKKVAKDLNLSFNIIYSRIENFKNIKIFNYWIR